VPSPQVVATAEVLVAFRLDRLRREASAAPGCRRSAAADP
jgi:hypothetical protein